MSETKDVHFKCPDCGLKMVALDFVAKQGVICPDCQKQFTPEKFDPPPIEVVCPKCKHDRATSPSAGMLRCESCHHYFPAFAEPKPIAKISTNNPASVQLTRVEKIREHAETFSTVAIIMVGLAAISVLVFLFGLTVENPSATALYFAASFLSLAVWLYLIAQIIHIRANTEK
jgi:ribosomal protein L37AE/L43A